MTTTEFAISIVVTVGLIICSFIGGLKLSDYYHRCSEEAVTYALQKQFVRLQAGADADDPAGPYVSRQKIQLPPEFEEKIKQNGRATISI